MASSNAPSPPPKEPIEPQPNHHNTTITTRTPSSATTDTAHDIEKTESNIPPPTSDDHVQHALTNTSSITPMPPFRKTLTIMTAVYLTIFLVSLDRTIVGVALPALSNDFHSFGDIGWYGSAYLMTTCAFQLFMGKIYTFYNVKWVFLFCIGMFELGSLIDGVAPNSVAFIWGRAISGIGSAGIQNGGVAIMVSITPLSQRPVWMGLIGAVFGVASVLGPVLGGVFTSDVTWRWCFYINLPFGGIAAATVILLLRSDSLARKPPTWREQVVKLDPLGTLLFLPAIVCLILALQWGGSAYNWSNVRIIVLFILFGLLLLLWCLNQVYQGDNATVPPRIINNRSIYGGFWFVTMLGSCMLTMSYWLPDWFQAIKGVSAAKAGVMNIPLVLSLVVAAVSTGVIVRQLGYYTPFMLLSSALATAGAALFQLFTPTTAHPLWIGAQVLLGFGIGLGLQQAALAAQVVLPRRDVPMGVALMLLGQNLGGAVFVSVAQTVLNNRLAANLAGIPGIDPTRITSAGATAFQSMIPAAYRGRALQAYNDALVKVFVIAIVTGAVAMLGAAVVEWTSVKEGSSREKKKGGSGGHTAAGVERSDEARVE